MPNLHCHWKMSTEDKEQAHDHQDWHLLAGQDEGFTQISAASASSHQAAAVWNHPLDMHYVTSAVKKWPHMFIEVWSQDTFGRNEIAGYGMLLVPATPGEHKLECVLWRPFGSWIQRLSARFLGGYPRLAEPEKMVLQETRYPLRTETIGTVHVTMHIITNSTAKLGLETG
eukprot:FR742934.1.p1 GENE.FR742934.1~~FR742934.1.p1  ORF type:complete len:171 (+),score=9.21 FR742934.1:1-513(+)